MKDIDEIRFDAFIEIALLIVTAIAGSAAIIYFFLA